MFKKTEKVEMKKSTKILTYVAGTVLAVAITFGVLVGLSSLESSDNQSYTEHVSSESMF